MVADVLGWYFGAAERNRTPDLLITNQLLYQLSYSSTVRHYKRRRACRAIRSTARLVAKPLGQGEAHMFFEPIQALNFTRPKFAKARDEFFNQHFGG